jgi:2-polyprenyl-6-methoxyphenol hydroxylase-like FAD-dependent oxidoreductase
LARWKNDVRLLAGDQIVPLLDKIVHTDQLVLASYTDIQMNHWHHGNVLAIGDCAHAMSP